MTMSTAEHLVSSYDIDPVVSAEVEEIAERQRRDYPSYHTFLDAMGASIEGVIDDVPGYRPVHVLDIRPDEHDPDEALRLHLPMANPLDANQRYQIATIAHANPYQRIIVTANPSGRGYDSGELRFGQRRKVARADFAPVVFPGLAYLSEMGIRRIRQAGYSYGATTSQAEAISGEIEIVRSLKIEPATVKRWLWGLPIGRVVALGIGFGRTNAALGEYSSASEDNNFDDARGDSVGMATYLSGLLRPTNIADARGLARDDFASREDRVLETHPNMVSINAWGTGSEFGLGDAMPAIISALTARFPGRVFAHPMSGHRHALANDIFAHAALIRQHLG